MGNPKIDVCRKIFRAVVEPFEVNFCRRDGSAAELF
jgi:hypothetical protein